MQHAPTRNLKIGQKGEDVRRLQVALNDRLDARGRHGDRIAVDGVYGAQTARTVHAVARALGAAEATIAEGATIGIQRIVRSPKTRTPAQLARAGARAAAAAAAKLKRPLRLKAYDQAVKFLAEGVREVGGNNVGARVVEIIRMNGGIPGESWCGDFDAACYILAGSRTVQRMWASTIWLLAKMSVVKHPLRGQLVVYTFGTSHAQHTGIFDEWDVPGVSFWAIEGNTRAGSSVSDAGGGEGVGRRHRTVAGDGAYFRRVLA